HLQKVPILGAFLVVFFTTRALPHLKPALLWAFIRVCGALLIANTAFLCVPLVDFIHSYGFLTLAYHTQVI
ncbi:hypothetical protein, partial [Helicobacter suis]|uniref:hypothetical protein n=1 Tax=Helicobacter suis TaxID=104628 RepID=UPI0019672056